jgi:hypothetical protein
MSLYGVLRYWQVWNIENQLSNVENQNSKSAKFLGISLFDIPCSTFNIQKIVLYSGYLAAITGIIGYFLAYFGIYDLVRLDGNYPFLGAVFRTKGFFANPIFFVTHVGCVLLMTLAQTSPTPSKGGELRREPLRVRFLTTPLLWKGRGRSEIRDGSLRSSSLPFGEGWGGAWGGAGLLLIALLLTKIKSLLSLFGILCFIFAWFTKARWQKWSSAAVGTISIVAYLFFSHWLILDRNNPNFEATLHEPFYSTNDAWTPLGSHYVLMPTFYTARKNLACLFGERAFPWGIGGNELTAVQDSVLEAKGMDLMRETAPHSTFWGVFAELGLLGMIALFALFWASFQAIRNKFDIEIQPFYLGILAFLFLEAFTVDLMNVRILWVLLALL